jgi:hypothetical protein
MGIATLRSGLCSGRIWPSLFHIIQIEIVGYGFV